MSKKVIAKHVLTELYSLADNALLFRRKTCLLHRDTHRYTLRGLNGCGHFQDYINLLKKKSPV